VQAECPVPEVKSHAYLERGKEKQEIVGELCLLVSAVEAKPYTWLKWITFLGMSIIIKQTHISDSTISEHVKSDKNL